MELLRQQLIAYRPWNEQEERDREELLRRLDSHEDLYTRANAAAHLPPPPGWSARTEARS